MIANTNLSPKVLDLLISQISSLASVYHKPESTFVSKPQAGVDEVQRIAIEEQIANANEDPLQVNQNGNVENLLDIDFGAPAPPPSAVSNELNLGNDWGL